MATIRIIFWRSFYKVVNPFRRLYWRIAKPHTRGVKAVVIYQGKFLLVRIAYAHKDWTFSGGKVDKNETFEQAAWRELREETGIVPDSLALIGEYHTNWEGKQDTVQCFYGESKSDSVKIDPLEILEIGWFERDAFPNGYRPTIDKIMALYDGYKKI